MFDLKKPINQLALMLFLLGMGIILASVAIAFVPQNNDLQNVNMLRISQMMAQLLTFFVPSMLLIYFTNQQVPLYPTLLWNLSWKNVGWVLLLFLVSMPLMEKIIAWNEALTLPQSMKAIEEWMRMQENEMTALTDKMIQATSVPELLLNILVMAIVPAICEELLFRGVLQNWLAQLISNKHVVIWLTAIIFSAIHIQFYGFVPRMLLGALLGYLFVWTKSIWVNIFAHFLNNALSVVSVYVCYLTHQDYKEVSFLPSWWSLSLLLTIGVIFLVYRSTHKSCEVVSTDN